MSVERFHDTLPSVVKLVVSLENVILKTCFVTVVSLLAPNSLLGFFVCESRVERQCMT